MSESTALGELVWDLALGLREIVLPELGAHAGRAHVEPGQGDTRGAGGDVTFAIDERAESFMERYLAEHAPGVAFYSEDRGLVTPEGAEAEWVLIVDPIDGTRPALAGFESACVSIAAAPLNDEPTMGDVEIGCVVEIKSGVVFRAERGRGIEPQPKLSRNGSLERMFWAYGLRGRPVRDVAEVLAGLIDASSVGGGTFDLGSASFDVTRIVTGQLDAYIEPGPRMVADVPGMRERFEALGGGAVLNNSPYDLAAAALCMNEAGAVITDAYGESLDPCPLLGSGQEFQISCVAAANGDLHTAICSSLEEGFERLATLGAPTA